MDSSHRDNSIYWVAPGIGGKPGIPPGVGVDGVSPVEGVPAAASVFVSFFFTTLSRLRRIFLNTSSATTKYQSPNRRLRSFTFSRLLERLLVFVQLALVLLLDPCPLGDDVFHFGFLLAGRLGISFSGRRRPHRFSRHHPPSTHLPRCRLRTFRLHLRRFVRAGVRSRLFPWCRTHPPRRLPVFPRPAPMARLPPHRLPRRLIGRCFGGLRGQLG